jgi:hypothetical protein
MRCWPTGAVQRRVRGRVADASETALTKARRRVGPAPLRALFDSLRGPAATLAGAVRCAGVGCWSARSTQRRANAHWTAEVDAWQVATMQQKQLAALQPGASSDFFQRGPWTMRYSFGATRP